MGQLTGLAVREARVVGAQHGYQHLMLTLSGGRRAFAKALAAPDQGAVPDHGAVPDQGTVPDRAAVGPGAAAAEFAAEANGLRWLAEAAAVPVPGVLAVGPEALVISV